MSRHFKAYALPFSDPDLIDDADEAYGDWPWIEEVCEGKSPVGQCQYSILDPETCIHCGKKT